MAGKDAKCVAVYGRRGSGKSTLAKNLIAGERRVVVFDPRAEYDCREVSGELANLGAAIRDSYSDFRLRIVPDPARWPKAARKARMLYRGAPFEAALLSMLCETLWLIQRPYEAGARSEKLTLVVEEMDLSFPSRFLPAGLEGMTRTINQGRHVGLNVLGITQRPALVSATFRGNVSDTFIFPLGWAADRGDICQMIGREHLPAISQLGNFEYRHATADGAVNPGKISPKAKKIAVF